MTLLLLRINCVSSLLALLADSENFEITMVIVNIVKQRSGELWTWRKNYAEISSRNILSVDLSSSINFSALGRIIQELEQEGTEESA